MYGWFSMHPAGTNNELKLVLFSDAFCIFEDDDFSAWVTRMMSEMTERPLQTIQLIATDGKTSEPLFRSLLPGKDIILFSVLF